MPNESMINWIHAPSRQSEPITKVSASLETAVLSKAEEQSRSPFNRTANPRAASTYFCPCSCSSSLGEHPARTRAVNYKHPHEPSRDRAFFSQIVQGFGAHQAADLPASLTQREQQWLNSAHTVRARCGTQPRFSREGRVTLRLEPVCCRASRALKLISRHHLFPLLVTLPN